MHGTANQDLPVWRSILFVPAHVDRFVDRAHERGADAILLDLEDSVAPEDKQRARDCIPHAVERVGRASCDVGVRVNRALSLAVRDIEAAVIRGVSFLALPKIDGPEHVRLISQLIEELEVERDLPVGSVRLLVNVESARAFGVVGEIANADRRIAALTLGSEDFALSCGFEPSADALYIPKQLALIAARAAGVLPIGFLGSVSNFSDLDEFRSTIRRSRALGFAGGYAIHPSQVAILNEEFGPTVAEIEYAEALLAARVHEGHGAFRFRGKMVDQPIFARAERVVMLASRLQARTSADLP